MLQADDYTLHNEQKSDILDIETLLDMAFGTGRYSRTVNILRYHIAPHHPLCYVVRAQTTMQHQGVTIAHNSLIALIRYYKVQATNGGITFMLGPLAVHPALQGLGLGKHIIKHSLTQIDNHYTQDTVFIVGDAQYYKEFGFIPVTNGQCYLSGAVEPLQLLVRLKNGGAVSPIYQGQLDYINP